MGGDATPDFDETRGPAARLRILEAAEALFAEQGYDRTSTASIAVAAGVPSGLVFYHFRTKMGLLLSVVRDERTHDLDVDLPTRPDDVDLHTHIADLWRYLQATLGAPSPVRRIVIQELSAHPEVRERALELQTRVATAVSERLARATGHHGPPLPVHVAAATLLTMTAAMASVYDQSADTLVDAEAVVALVENGLRR